MGHDRLHRDLAPCVRRGRSGEKRERFGQEMWVRTKKVTAIVLHEAHERQVGQAMDPL